MRQQQQKDGKHVIPSLRRRASTDFTEYVSVDISSPRTLATRTGGEGPERGFSGFQVRVEGETKRVLLNTGKCVILRFGEYGSLDAANWGETQPKDAAY